MHAASKIILGSFGALGLALGLSSFGTAATAIAPAAGKIKGKIVFDGEIPTAKPLKITAEQSVGCCAEGESVDSTDRSLLIDSKGGIANVVVTLTIEGRKPKLPTEPIHLDQTGCRFEPHVVIIPAGAKVAYVNSDDCSHNVHTYAMKNGNLNKTVAKGGTLEQVLDKAEAVKVACDIHPWMASYIFVTDASAWALSGKDGSFELPELPPGSYDLEIWHEKLGKARAKATIAEDGSSQPVEVKLEMKEKKGGRRRR